MRVVFIKSAEAKERLKPAMMPANVDKTMIAPATAIIGYDKSFWKDFAKNYPIRPEMAERFKGDENVAEKFAYQQATLQGAYFIMAVRAVAHPGDHAELGKVGSPRPASWPGASVHTSHELRALNSLPRSDLEQGQELKEPA